jgi:hypothetical protein
MSETCETNEMRPFLAPMDCGAKMALKVKLSPFARVKVKSSPITANPVPRVVTCNRLSSESPALVIVTIPNFLWRRATFPKPRVAGKDQMSIARSRLAEGDVRCLRARN